MQRMNISIAQVTLSAVLDSELLLLRVAGLVSAGGNVAPERPPPSPGPALPRHPRGPSGRAPRSRSLSRSHRPNPATNAPNVADVAAVSAGIGAPKAARERGSSLHPAAALRACGALLAAPCFCHCDCLPVPCMVDICFSLPLHLRWSHQPSLAVPGAAARSTSWSLSCIIAMTLICVGGGCACLRGSFADSDENDDAPSLCLFALPRGLAWLL